MRARVLEQLSMFPDLEPPTARTRRRGPVTSREAENYARLSGRMGRGMYQALELVYECGPATTKEMAAVAALPDDARWSHFFRMDLQELRRRVSDCKLEKNGGCSWPAHRAARCAKGRSIRDYNLWRPGAARLPKKKWLLDQGEKCRLSMLKFMVDETTKHSTGNPVGASHQAAARLQQRPGSLPMEKKTLFEKMVGEASRHAAAQGDDKFNSWADRLLAACFAAAGAAFILGWLP